MVGITGGRPTPQRPATPRPERIPTRSPGRRRSRAERRLLAAVDRLNRLRRRPCRVLMHGYRERRGAQLTGGVWAEGRAAPGHGVWHARAARPLVILRDRYRRGEWAGPDDRAAAGEPTPATPPETPPAPGPAPAPERLPGVYSRADWEDGWKLALDDDRDPADEDGGGRGV